MQPSTIIRHPNKPEISVTIALPRQAERIAMGQARERANFRHVPVYDLDGKPITINGGEVQTVPIHLPVSPAQKNDDLKVYVVAMEGVPSPGGDLLTFGREQKADRDRVIADGVLFDDVLNVSLSYAEANKVVGRTNIVEAELEKRIDAEPDEEKRAVLRASADAILASRTTMTFADYILHKASDLKTFDPDPTGEGSRSS